MSDVCSQPSEDIAWQMMCLYPCCRSCDRKLPQKFPCLPLLLSLSPSRICALCSSAVTWENTCFRSVVCCQNRPSIGRLVNTHRLCLHTTRDSLQSKIMRSSGPHQKMFFNQYVKLLSIFSSFLYRFVWFFRFVQKFLKIYPTIGKWKENEWEILVSIQKHAKITWLV